jgi:hypothetical protein
MEVGEGDGLVVLVIRQPLEARKGSESPAALWPRRCVDGLIAIVEQDDAFLGDVDAETTVS